MFILGDILWPEVCDGGRSLSHFIDVVCITVTPVQVSPKRW